MGPLGLLVGLDLGHGHGVVRVRRARGGHVHGGEGRAYKLLWPELVYGAASEHEVRGRVRARARDPFKSKACLPRESGNAVVSGDLSALRRTAQTVGRPGVSSSSGHPKSTSRQQPAPQDARGPAAPGRRLRGKRP